MGNLPVATELQQTPGQMIKAVREAKQISLSEVAQNLLLGKHTIIALEADDYSNISAEVYAEGYLKAYAKFLQIPVEEVLGSFHRLNVYSDFEVKSEVKSKSNNDVTWTLKDQRVLLGLLLFLILTIVVLVMVKHLGKNSGVIDSPTAAAQVQVSTSKDSHSINDSSLSIDKDQLPVITSSVADSISDQALTTDNS